MPHRPPRSRDVSWPHRDRTRRTVIRRPHHPYTQSALGRSRTRSRRPATASSCKATCQPTRHPSGAASEPLPHCATHLRRDAAAVCLSDPPTPPPATSPGRTRSGCDPTRRHSDRPNPGGFNAGRRTSIPATEPSTLISILPATLPPAPHIHPVSPSSPARPRTGAPIARHMENPFHRRWRQHHPHLRHGIERRRHEGVGVGPGHTW